MSFHAGLGWGLLAALAAGCDAPAYRDAEVDAASSSEPSDAGVVEASTRPDAAVDPSGRYAMLIRFYGRDAIGGGSWFAEDHLSLAEIRAEGGAWTLTDAPCRHHLVAWAPPFVTGELVVPERAPTRTFTLQSDDGTHFRSSGAPSLLGYEPVKDCVKQRTEPSRSWLPQGVCTCPSNDAPPTRTDDCRVIDSDGDGHPGATVRYSSGNDSYMAIRDRSQLTGGTFAADGRHHASYLRLADVSTMQCTAGFCSPASVVTCAESHNPVVFLPLPEDAPDGSPWTCGALLGYLESHPLELADPSKPDC